MASLKDLEKKVGEDSVGLISSHLKEHLVGRDSKFENKSHGDAAATLISKSKVVAERHRSKSKLQTKNRGCFPIPQEHPRFSRFFLFDKIGMAQNRAAFVMDQYEIPRQVVFNPLKIRTFFAAF